MCGVCSNANEIGKYDILEVAVLEEICTPVFPYAWSRKIYSRICVSTYFL
jgi:hypothetical protein